jgi:hypothetical protein
MPKSKKNTDPTYCKAFLFRLEAKIAYTFTDPFLGLSTLLLPSQGSLYYLPNNTFLASSYRPSHTTNLTTN